MTPWNPRCPRDHAWIARHHQGHALPHRLDPAKGLLADDFATLRQWAAGLGEGRSPVRGSVGL
ncbi:hypothetical protein [Streptomyces decoyicus]|uniref:hypothetical protein n=1 Tax=Streptomyces decoyicus TaxID=249567 RepID=UPI0004AAB11C|nr:hypothetical protein [Streptomyces decoyicus]KOG37567.1 hypothetical protein ADK74_35925 [Streptomyces decoyicus]QZY14808.1 hypothetical protein K7C20_05740 [Streptomyces decoyicus]